MRKRWKTIYKKTDALQESVDSTKLWFGGLTTIVTALITLIVKTSI